MKTGLRVIVIGVVAIALAGNAAMGAGFSIYEQSSKASGYAGAWVARADDAAANWYNPAALVWMEGSEFQIGITAISGGGDTDFTASDPSFGIFTPTVYSPESFVATPFHVYFAQKVSPTIAWGIGLNVPFGLATNWNDRPITFAAFDSELVTLMLNTNVAFQVGDNWGIAIGVDYVMAEVTEFSREIPIDLDANPFNGFELIGVADLTGEGSDLGWNTAVHYKSDNFSFGLTYRSDLAADLNGQIDYSGFGPLGMAFPNTTGSVTFNMPDSAAVGFGWQVGDRWWTEIDATWTGWSVFKELNVDLDAEVPGFSEDFVIAENWDDSMAYRLGVSRTSDSGNELRFGIGMDESPVPAETLRPSIPDADRMAYTLGYGINRSNWHVDLYYMYLTFDDRAAAPGFADGVIGGTYSSFGQLAGITYGRTF